MEPAGGPRGRLAVQRVADPRADAERHFDLSVIAEPAEGTATGTAQEGIGCGMTFAVGEAERVTVTIDGLQDFGDKGYGPCNATVERG